MAFHFFNSKSFNGLQLIVVAAEKSQVAGLVGPTERKRFAMFNLQTKRGGATCSSFGTYVAASSAVFPPDLSTRLSRYVAGARCSRGRVLDRISRFGRNKRNDLVYYCVHESPSDEWGISIYNNRGYN